MTALPSFSILICNCNYAGFVGQAIQSALDQNYPADRMQVIVVDDGSTDGSRAVIERFKGDTRGDTRGDTKGTVNGDIDGDAKGTPRVQIVFQENRGQTGAFEAGIKLATGDCVCLLDSEQAVGVPPVGTACRQRRGAGCRCAAMTQSLQSHEPVDFYRVQAHGGSQHLPELGQMAQGYAASGGEYLVFMRAGDRLDRDLVERHLHWRRQCRPACSGAARF